MSFHHESEGANVVPLFMHANSPARLSRSLRETVAAEAQRLIDWLDILDGDPDFEPGADMEPTLGWTRTYAVGDLRDLEIDEVTL